MLKLNQYYWKLYSDSIEGREAIQQFIDLAKNEFEVSNVLSIIEKYDPEYLNLKESGMDVYFESIHYGVMEMMNRLKELPMDLSIKEFEDFIKRNDEYVLNNIVPLSFLLYQAQPEYFVPYLFLFRFQYLEQLADNLDLDFGNIPGPNDKAKRCLFYLAICDELYKYRKFNELSNAELCALIYDMERKAYDSEFSQESTPYPRVWWIVGRKIEEEARSKAMFFQANPETKKGDIFVFYEKNDTYERSHRSAITGIWTALMNGSVDPFFHYYRYTFIGNEIPIIPIPFRLIKNDELTATIKGVSAQFQNYSGREISGEDYDRIIQLIKKHMPSFDESRIPKRYSEEVIEGIPYEERGDMKPEKWVEENRIIPLLNKLGWGRPDIDYRRQVYLQLGRKKSTDSIVQSGRPDFSVFPFGDHRKCADIVIEAKGPGEMEGDKKLRDAFDQGESYASRQYAELLILADDKQLLFYSRSKNGNFRFTNTPYKQYEWATLLKENSEELTEVYHIFLSFQKHKPK